MTFDPHLQGIIFGAGIALFGTFLGLLVHVISLFLDYRNRRNVFLREKCEQIAECVSQTIPWFSKVSDCSSIKQVGECLPPLEARRAAVLAMLYFPRLEKPAIEYLNGLVEHHQWLIGLSGLNQGHPVGVLSAGHPEFEKMHGKIDDLRRRLDESIALQTKRHF